MKTTEEFLKENKIIHRMIAEHCGEAEEAKLAWPNWAYIVDQERVNKILREIYAGMLASEKKCTKEDVPEFIDKLVSERLKEQSEKAGNGDILKIYIPENDYGIKQGYYDRNGLVGLLAEYHSKPSAIVFIADMLEE
jgi:uncharacterized membrane-anchored protein YjiN (DUF445 family)